MTWKFPPLSLVCLNIALRVGAQRFDGQYWPCNPMKNYWSTSNYANINYNKLAKNGAEFTVAKRHDAPQLFSDFYIFFGRVDVVMQVAPGTGIISSSVLMSDDFDEIDWEMSGNKFNLTAQYPSGVVQNNYFSKGITGLYDRGMWVPCSQPQTTFHTYSVDWTPTKLDWLLDGKVIRTFLAANADSTTHQFPQTPSKIQMGMWDGGDPEENSGTMSWAGGMTDLTKAPFTMFVKSVRITNYNPAKYYNWTDQSGSWKSIKALNISLPSSTTTAEKSTTTAIQPLRTDLPVSPNGHCGISVNTVCKGSLFGDCCSAFGYYGNTTESILSRRAIYESVIGGVCAVISVQLSGAGVDREIHVRAAFHDTDIGLVGGTTTVQLSGAFFDLNIYVYQAIHDPGDDEELCVALPNYQSYIQAAPTATPSPGPGDAYLLSSANAGQFNVIEGQLVYDNGNDDPLYMGVEDPANKTQRTLETWFDAAENTYGTFAFQGDTLTWEVDDIARPNTAAWLVCGGEGRLYVNTGAYAYERPTAARIRR
ncbi:Uu.00g025140.m01.CDS01 [Anthostomella pinea]|uniref:Uu.00g025140.m01.CDS01 n=1 Tax=Anthostomella pinea TaxID=933095 RepID=A0AAI8V8A8_9PEZI|nr:Uu.00g025140.m01.CDS01 [Anthostomella pinea]